MEENGQPIGEGGGPVDAEEDHRPLIERIGDKNWKTRLVAYENLKGALLEAGAGDPVFSQYGPWLSKMTGDTNNGALDAALDAAITWADLAPCDTVKSYTQGEDGKVFANVVDKAFSGKSSTLAKGKALLLKVMEVIDPRACTLFLLSRLGDKKPKVPPTSLEVIKDGIGLFGAQPFPVKEIIAALGPVLNGTNGPARELSLALMLELTRWIGKAPFNALLESIRSAQKTEFERVCAEKDAEDLPSPLPSLWLRKDRPEPGSEALVAAVHLKKDSSREYIEEVDIIKKLKPSEYATLIVSDKWSEQLKALQLVIDGLGPTPKVKAGCDVHDIVSACKGFLRLPGSHLQVLVASLRVCALLAEGMRAEFSSFVRPITQSIIGKCKEKKLVPEVQATLYLVLKHCLNFEPLSEDVIEHIRSKKVAPHGRVCMMDFVVQALAEHDTAVKIATDMMKPLAEALISCCEDSDPKIRDSSAATLAAMAPIVKSRGRPALEAHKTLMALEQSLPRVFKKIQQAMDSAPTPTTAPSGPSGGGAKAAPKSLAAKHSTASHDSPPPAVASSGSSRFDDDYAPPARPAPKAAAKRPSALSGSGGVPAAAKKSAASSAGGAKKASAASNEKEDDTVEDLSMNAEDAEEALAGLGIEGWEDTIQAAMSSSNWQVKADAVTAIGQKIADLSVGGQYSAALVVYLSSKTSAFKISNTNILKAVIQTACQAASNTGSGAFSKPAAWELIKHLGDKLSDKKTKDLVGSLLSALSASVRPVFVVKRMQYVMDKTKAPLAHQHYLEWLKEAITDLGASSFPVPALGAFCQLELDNKVAAVRTAAVEVMGALYHQIGPRLASVAMSDDMKPAVRALLEAEYGRVGYDPGAGKVSTKGGDSDGLSIPRADLFSLVDKNILAELNLVEGKTSWQNRKVAIESIISACERSGHFLDASKAAQANLSEVLKSLKARVNDTQANLKPLAASAIGHVIASLEPEQGCKFLRSIAGGLISGLGDNKKPMRDATMAAMQMAVTVNRPGGDHAPAEMSLLAVLIGPLGEALAATVVGRQELLTFLTLYAETFHAPVDCTDLPTPLVIAMQDKTAVVRSLAETLLGVLNARALIPKQALDKATRDLAPAAKRTLMPSVERMMAQWGSKRGGHHADEESVETAITAVTAVSLPPRSPPPTRAAPSIVIPERKMSVSSIVPQSPVVKASRHSSVASLITGLEQGEELGTGGSWMLKKCSQAAHQKRLDDFHRQNWPQPPEEIGEAELSVLRGVWEPLISSELSAIIFATAAKGALANQDNCLVAVNELINQLQGTHALQHTDLLLRYACYALSLRETASGLLKVLTLITEVFSMVRDRGQMLHEAEMACIMPHLIDKSGHKSERHRGAFKSALLVAASLIPASKLCHLLLHGLNCKNKRTRVVCIEEIQGVVEVAGAQALGRGGVKEIAMYLDSKDNDIAVYLDSKDNDVSGRNACLELCYSLYLSLGGELPKIMKLLGADLSERSTSMVEDRVRQKNKASGGLSNALSAFASHGHSSSLASSVVSAGPSAKEQSTAAAAALAAPAAVGTVPVVKRNVVMSSAPPSSSVPAVPDRGFMSPDRESRESYESSPSPFRLEITPPAADPAENEQTHTYSNVSPPKGLNMHAEGPVYPNKSREADSPTLPSMAPGWAAPTPNKFRPPVRAVVVPPAAPFVPSPQKRPVQAWANSASGSRIPLEGIYADIANKVDQYLCALVAQSEDDPHTSPLITGLCDETKDYLKMLHSIAIGEWSQETLPEDDEALKTQIAPLCVRLTRCVAASFTLSMPHASPTSLLGIDVSLVAVSLATLFAIVRRTDLSLVMDKDCLTDIFQECLRRIVDQRLGTGNADSSPKSQESNRETIQQIVRALNIVLLRLAAEAPSGLVMGSLITVLYLCIPSSEVDHTGDLAPLPTTSMKPTSRLLLRVLGEEAKKESPFSAPLDPKALLVDIHVFLSRQPNVGTVDDTPLTAVKAVLSEMIKALGGETVMVMLSELSMPVASLIFKLTSRISNLPLPAALSFEEGGGEGGNEELHGQLTVIIDDITSARDKMVPIRQLHALKREHPGTDINQYLQKISAAFRRFVLDTLAKLDEQDRDKENGQGPPRQADNMTHVSAPALGLDRGMGAKQPSSTYIRPSNGVDNASEAMRIIEGLKNKPFVSLYMQGRDSPHPEGSPATAAASARRTTMSNTPRTLMNDRIRGTLSNLSSTLDLPNLPPSASNGHSPPRPGPATAQSQADKGGAFPLGSERGDNDLAARLQRLKNMEKK